jgi:hypothetical protein
MTNTKSVTYQVQFAEIDEFGFHKTATFTIPAGYNPVHVAQKLIPGATAVRRYVPGIYSMPWNEVPA